MKNKSFDCVEMKHRAAANISKELAGKDVSGQLEYWKKQYDEMKKKARAAAHA